MKKLIILFAIIAVIVLASFMWWNNGIQAANRNDKSQIIFVVRSNENIRDIGFSLKKAGLIRDPVVFFILVKQMGLDGKIQAGDFRLSPSMSAEDVAKNLTHGTLDVWVTIPEGKRAEEIAALLKDKLPTYDDSWKTQLMQNEGYLFPDTYLIPHAADVTSIIKQMRDNFDAKFTSLQSSSSSSMTQLVIIASLVEREAKYAEDRPLVASVIYNRLKTAMVLNIDATIQYALGYNQNERSWWKKNLTADDLKISSPYNTYQNQGLPPTPICNPGLSALQAAAQPAPTDYKYYISDQSGHLHFAKTLEEHNANIKKYGL